MTKIWTPPSPTVRHAHANMHQLYYLTKIWTPHTQSHTHMHTRVNDISVQKSGPPHPHTHITISNSVFLSDQNFNNYMQAVYTDVESSKLAPNGVYPIDTCNVLEAVHNLNEGDAKVEEQHCREAAAQGLVDKQEGQCTTRKSKYHQDHNSFQ